MTLPATTGGENSSPSNKIGGTRNFAGSLSPSSGSEEVVLGCDGMLAEAAGDAGVGKGNVLTTMDFRESAGVRAARTA